jgi:hypothetical protein
MKRYVSFFTILIVLLSSTVVFAQEQQQKTGKLRGKKIVMIIAKRMFEESEYKYPREIFDIEKVRMSLLHPAHCP